MVPIKRITDPTFSYTPSHETNIGKTFARIKKQRADETAAELERLEKLRASITPIRMQAVK